MRPNLFILLFIAFAIPSCHAQQKDDGRTYNKEYAVGSIPSVNNFLTLTKQEKELDSLFNSEYNSTGNSQKLRHMPGNSFRSNRARILLYQTTNGNRRQIDPSLKNGVPTMCRCSVDSDTLEINMALGFFGGVGVNIKVYGKEYASWFFQENDNAENLKANLFDTTFSNHVIVENKGQYLVLDKQPDFKPGQQIAGYFTFTSADYFEKKNKNIDTISASGKIHFTCHPGQRIKNLERR